MYKVWYYQSDEVTIHSVDIASLSIYNNWVWFDTMLSRYFFKVGDGSDTNVVIIPKYSKDVTASKEEAYVFADFLEQIIGSEKAESFRSNLQESKITLSRLGEFVDAIPDWLEQLESSDKTSSYEINCLVSKTKLDEKDLLRIAASANRLVMSVIRLPKSDVYPVSSSPATIIAVPREDISKDTNYKSFREELNLLFSRMYADGITNKPISFTDGKIIDVSTILDLLEMINIIPKSLESWLQQSTEQSSQSGSS